MSLINERKIKYKGGFISSVTGHAQSKDCLSSFTMNVGKILKNFVMHDEIQNRRGLRIKDKPR